MSDHEGNNIVHEGRKKRIEKILYTALSKAGLHQATCCFVIY